MAKIIKINENTIKKVVTETLKKVLNEVRGWTLEDDDWRFVNDENAGSTLYAVRIWPGSGYFLPAYAAFANSDEEALDYVVAFIEKNDPEILADEEHASMIKDNIENGMSEDEAEEYADNSFIYVDATMEGADAPHYIFSDNFRINVFPTDKKERVLAARASQLNESAVGNVFTELDDAFLGTIDYLYNEGVVDYDDAHLTAYKNGKAIPDYKDIAKTALIDYLPNLSREARALLRNYIQTGEPKELDAHILNDIKDFAEKGNCEMLANFFEE